MDEIKQPPVLALVRDLLFASKIALAAKNAGVEVKIVRDPAQLADQAAPLMLVDLNQAGTIDAAANWKRITGRRVVGFVSHVDVEVARLARASGIDKVMARSGFVDSLPGLFAEVAMNR